MKNITFLLITSLLTFNGFSQEQEVVNKQTADKFRHDAKFILNIGSHAVVNNPLDESRSIDYHYAFNFLSFEKNLSHKLLAVSAKGSVSQLTGRSFYSGDAFLRYYFGDLFIDHKSWDLFAEIGPGLMYSDEQFGVVFGAGGGLRYWINDDLALFVNQHAQYSTTTIRAYLQTSAGLSLKF